MAYSNERLTDSYTMLLLNVP